jgi:hypothetical protein
MTKYAKIIEEKYLVRDMYSKAVLNTDTSAVRRHEKRLMDLQKEEVRDKEINSLRSELSEIKKLLYTMITNKTV